MHAHNIPAQPCEFDKSRSVCPEDREMRQTYLVEATAKPKSWSETLGCQEVIIPKRIPFIHSKG